MSEPGQPGEGVPPPAFHGSTIRFYDPAIDAWRSSSVEPINGRVRRFIGRVDGADIVLISDEEGPQLRWRFADIEPASFTWRSEYPNDEGPPGPAKRKCSLPTPDTRRFSRKWLRGPGTMFDIACDVHRRVARSSLLQAIYLGGLMRYALLVCNDDSAEVTPAEESARFAAFSAFADTMLHRGVMGDRGVRLRPTRTATTVRVRRGDVVIADGPFAETKEQIGGFYLVDCDDLDEAIEIASQIPGAQFGSIEVRPVWEF